MRPTSHLTAVLLFIGAMSPLWAENRVFVNNTGGTLRGELVEVKGDKVTIRREDGQTFTLEAGSFCPKDQAYFKEHTAPDPNALSNSFLGIPFGTNEETAVKETEARTHAEPDAKYTNKDQRRLNHGTYLGFKTDSFVLIFKEGKLEKVNVFGFVDGGDRKSGFDAVKHALAQQHGPPLAEVDSENHVHQEWAYPVHEQTQPYHISIDLTPTNTKYMLTYEGPPVLGVQLEPSLRPGPSVFSSTKWWAVGTDVEFSGDGTWVEHWGKKIWHGVWKPTTLTQIVVCREDGYIYHFDLEPDGKSVRRSDTVIFKKA